MENNETPPETFAPVMMPGLGKLPERSGSFKEIRFNRKGGDND